MPVNQSLLDSRALSRCATPDSSNSESYKCMVDKNITTIGKPNPANAISTSASVGPIVLRTNFYTPEPTTIASESSEEICNPSSYEDSSAFFHNSLDDPRSPPLQTVGLHQEGFVFTSAMNKVGDEAVEAYYASQDAESVSVLSNAGLNVSTSPLVAHR